MANKTKQEEEKDWEDPARCWIDLVEATRVPNKEIRDEKLKEIFAQAKMSHWTHQLFDEFLKELEDEEDAEYGGPIIEVPSDPEEWIDEGEEELEIGD